MRAQMQRPAATVAKLAIAIVFTTMLATIATISADDQAAPLIEAQPEPIAQQVPAVELAAPFVARGPEADQKQQQQQQHVVEAAAPVAGDQVGQPGELSGESSGQRQGRSESADSKTSDQQDKKQSSDAASSSTSATTSDKADKEKPKVASGDATKKAASSSSSTSSPRQPSSASKASSSSATKSKNNANLGTVTSTGSGGSAHYMSKHDAYSAIAEKHGALAHDAMRKSDKRRIQSSSPFGGIQKASGFGDFSSPIKGVGDTGLARSEYLPSRPKTSFVLYQFAIN